MALLLLHGNLKEKLVSFISKKRDNEVQVETADPCILWKGTCYLEGEYSIYAERIIIAQSKCLIKAYLILLSSFYVFNMAFPKNMSSTLTFLQKVILGHSDNSKNDLAKINGQLMKWCESKRFWSYWVAGCYWMYNHPIMWGNKRAVNPRFSKSGVSEKLGYLKFIFYFYLLFSFYHSKTL